MNGRSRTTLTIVLLLTIGFIIEQLFLWYLGVSIPRLQDKADQIYADEMKRQQESGDAMNRQMTKDMEEIQRRADDENVRRNQEEAMRREKARLEDERNARAQSEQGQ